MAFPLILRIIPFLCLTLTMALAISLAKPGCQEKCGNIIIPYPFGIGSKCSANSSFTVMCQNSSNPPTPWLSSLNVEVVNISLYGTILVNHPVTTVNCSVDRKTGSLPISFKGSPFTISVLHNSLVVLGCRNSVWLRANTTTVGGCTPLCDANSTDTSCNGLNCCKTTLSQRVKELEYTYRTTEASNGSSSSCGYVFPVDKRWFQKGYKSYYGLVHDMSNPFDQEFGFAPLVLEWEIGEMKGYTDLLCTYADDYCISYPDDFGSRSANNSKECQRLHHLYACRMYPTGFVCQSPPYDRNPNLYNGDWNYMYSTYNRDRYDYVSTIKYCSCPRGYEGNPYLGPEGCIDIDERSSHGTQ